MPDLGNSSVFNQADASNASGTMPSWSGAAAPSTLDDAGRALQGAVTREWNWRSYTLTAGGTADAKILTFSVAPAAYYNGQRFAFIANTTNTTSATLNVNSLGAKTIKKDVSGTLTNLSASDMVSGVFVEVAYNTANDCFVWVNRGIDAFPAGTAALPSITTTGDANTGFWFPAADTIAASTAGVERVRVDASGNVGIGITPTAPFHVYRNNTVTSAQVQIEQDGSGHATLGFLSTGVYAWLAGIDTVDNGFKIAASGTGLTTSTRLTIDTSGNILNVGPGGLGYGTGSGGTVTQGSTSGKTTIVTLNKTNGQITMNNAALAAGASITFQFNNTTIAATDVVVVNPGNFGTYTASTYFVTAGACGIRVTNISGGSLSEAVTINFAVIKATTS